MKNNNKLHYKTARLNIIVFTLILIVIMSLTVLGAQINSSSYRQTVIVSYGSENMSGASYKNLVSVGPISGVINSSSFINRLGFFYLVSDRNDTLKPNVTLNYPVNDFNTSVDSINFNWTAADNLDSSITCNLTINNIVVADSLVNETSHHTNFTAVNLSEGHNFWNVTCVDDAGNINTSERRNFTVVKGPLFVNATLAADNESIILDWGDINYSESYSIFIIDNFTQMFEPIANITGLTDSNYTDENAGNKTQRFYKIAGNKGSVNKTSTRTVGKFEFELINNTNAVTDWNLISLPLNITKFILNNGSNNGYDLPVKPLNCIKTLWSFNTTTSEFMRTDYNGSVWIPAAGSENFTNLEPSRAYWAEVNITCNLTIVGEVPTVNVTLNLTTGWNVMGWYSPNSSRLPTSYAPPYPIVVRPVNSVKAMDRYNPITDLWEVTNHLTVSGNDWGWWPSSNNKNFIGVDPTIGYYFDVLNNATWIHRPNTEGK